MKAVYLDYNATTPIDPEVITAMEPYLRNHFGNPSSSHAFGAATRRAVEKARKQVAILLGVHSHEIIFTSGGTESNNLAASNPQKVIEMENQWNTMLDEIREDAPQKSKVEIKVSVTSENLE